MTPTAPRLSRRAPPASAHSASPRGWGVCVAGGKGGPYALTDIPLSHSELALPARRGAIGHGGEGVGAALE